MKNKKKLILIGSIFIIFTIIALVLPVTKNAAFWCAYVCGAIAIWGQLYLFNVAYRRGKALKSKFYKLEIAKLSMLYLAVQVVLSIVEILLSSIISIWIILIVNILIVAAVIIGSIEADGLETSSEN